MGFQGNIASVNLADIFQTLAMNRQRVLWLSAMVLNHFIWFDRGAIAITDGTDEDGGHRCWLMSFSSWADWPIGCYRNSTTSKPNQPANS